MTEQEEISPEGEELTYADDYWNYIRSIIAKYIGRKDNDGKRIIKGN